MCKNHRQGENNDIFKYYEIQFFLVTNGTEVFIYAQQYVCMLGF